MSETVVRFDPFVPGFLDDPYPQYAALREADPVHHSALGAWMLFRYDDVFDLIRAKHSVEERNVSGVLAETSRQMEEQLRRETGGAVRPRRPRSMLNLDPPDHTRLRRLVAKAFTPRMMEGLRPRIEALVDAHLDAAAERGSMDVIADLAFPLPFQVISDMLGMPDADRDQLRDWSSTVVLNLDPVFDIEVLRQVAEAGDHMRAFIDETIAWKRDHPGDDLLTALIEAEDDGDALTAEELADQVTLLFIAGHETTVNLIGNGMLALLRDRRQLERLRDDPDLDAIAVDELLRYDSPVQLTRRILLEDAEYGGRRLEAGSVVFGCLASANRDPSRFGADAEDLRVDRAEAAQHVSFGGGVHHCLGAHLARIEGQVAVGSLLRRFPDIELAGEASSNGRINLRGRERIPVSLG